MVESASGKGARRARRPFDGADAVRPLPRWRRATLRAKFRHPAQSFYVCFGSDQTYVKSLVCHRICRVTGNLERMSTTSQVPLKGRRPVPVHRRHAQAWTDEQVNDGGCLLFGKGCTSLMERRQMLAQDGSSCVRWKSIRRRTDFHRRGGGRYKPCTNHVDGTRSLTSSQSLPIPSSSMAVAVGGRAAVHSMYEVGPYMVE